MTEKSRLAKKEVKDAALTLIDIVRANQLPSHLLAKARAYLQDAMAWLSELSV